MESSSLHRRPKWLLDHTLGSSMTWGRCGESYSILMSVRLLVTEMLLLPTHGLHFSYRNSVENLSMNFAIGRYYHSLLFPLWMSQRKRLAGRRYAKWGFRSHCLGLGWGKRSTSDSILGMDLVMQGHFSSCPCLHRRHSGVCGWHSGTNHQLLYFRHNPRLPSLFQ